MPNFLTQTGLSADLGIENGFGCGVKLASHSCVAIHIAMGHKGGVGMDSEYIAHLTHFGNGDAQIAFNGQTVNAGDNRAGGIGTADGTGNIAEPYIVIALLPALIGEAHHIGLVACFPGGDVIKALEPLYEIADKAQLPFNCFVVRNGIARLKCRREEHPAAHPTGDQRDDELHIILLCQKHKFLKPLDHNRVNTGKPLRCAAV